VSRPRHRQSAPLGRAIESPPVRRPYPVLHLLDVSAPRIRPSSPEHPPLFGDMLFCRTYPPPPVYMRLAVSPNEPRRKAPETVVWHPNQLHHTPPCPEFGSRCKRNGRGYVQQTTLVPEKPVRTTLRALSSESWGHLPERFCWTHPPPPESNHPLITLVTRPQPKLRSKSSGNGGVSVGPRNQVINQQNGPELRYCWLRPHPHLAVVLKRVYS